MTKPAVNGEESSPQPRRVVRSLRRWKTAVYEWFLSDSVQSTTEVKSSTHSVPVREFRRRQINTVFEWSSLDSFFSTAEVKSGVHSVPIGEFGGKQINYDFLLTARPGTALLCHFHGSTSREGLKLPLFTGIGVTSEIIASRFVPSDPMLRLDSSLGLAWHFGCDGIPLQSITVNIVKKLEEILQAPRVVTWGGSGGGFAAIRVAKDIRNGIALVWNPQTDIAKYGEDPVDRYLRVAFPALAGKDDLPTSMGQFPSLCTDEFVSGYQGRILYMQERTDGHVRFHLKPFLARFCGKPHSDIVNSGKFSGFINDQLYLHLDHWGDGHVPPSKVVLTKILKLLADSTVKLEQNALLQCFIDEAVDGSALSHPQQMQESQTSEPGASDKQPGAREDNELPDWSDVLAIRLDHIAEEFQPFDPGIKCSGETVVLPLFTGELVEVSLSQGVQWDWKFQGQAASSVMHLFSLELVGRLLSTFQKKNDADALLLAVVVLESFFNYSSSPTNQARIGLIGSADHSAATRVRVLIKFIQIARGRMDVEPACLARVCSCLKFWSDWLAAPENYKANNHGLMASISLFHSGLQFGSMPYAKDYLDVAQSRIIELGKSAFDKDGLCNENTVGYHNFNLQCYRGLLKFCKHYGLSESLTAFLEELILRASKALEICVWQDGSVPPVGDSSIYRLKITSRNESQCFFESGYAVVKSNDLYLSIICGARTEIHKHVDDSSITLRYKNQDILIDGGAYLYDQADPYRRCVESSRGHNGIFLKEFDGLLRKEVLNKFGPIPGKIEQFDKGADGVRIKCVYSICNGHVVVERKIFVCWPDEVAIVDSVERNEMAGRSTPVQRFIFGPSLAVSLEDREKLILASENLSCTMFQILGCDSDLYRGEQGNLIRGWFSKKYKEILPTYGVDFTRAPQGDRFSTIIKLTKCSDLSECSMAVRAFASQDDWHQIPQSPRDNLRNKTSRHGKRNGWW